MDSFPLHRDIMAKTPFTPAAMQDYQARQTHAAEYTAFYLGEIAAQLQVIAGQLQNGNASSSRIAVSLVGLQHVLPSLLKR
jgi:hypothetical protein